MPSEIRKVQNHRAEEFAQRIAETGLPVYFAVHKKIPQPEIGEPVEFLDSSGVPNARGVVKQEIPHPLFLAWCGQLFPEDTTTLERTKVWVRNMRIWEADLD